MHRPHQGLLLRFAAALIGLAVASPVLAATPPADYNTLQDIWVFKDALKGTWRGVFEQVQTGDSGRIHGDLECQIKDDGTYQMTWTSDLVAGSTRGGRVVMVVADGNLVSFDEPTSGSRTTLRRVGDTLYGVRLDPGTKHVSVSVEMHRIVAPEAP